MYSEYLMCLAPLEMSSVNKTKQMKACAASAKYGLALVINSTKQQTQPTTKPANSKR